MKTLELKDIVAQIDRQLEQIIGEELPILAQIKSYTIESGGKRVRPILLVLLGRLYGSKSEEGLLALGAIVEIIHAASLLHDDVLDNADTRRGKPSGKALFGSKEVILGGDYLLACGIRRLNEFGSSELMAGFTRVIRDLAVSELLQMQYERKKEITLDIYFKIIFGKTASLFQTACESAAIFSGCSAAETENAARLGANLGYFFQMRDDYLDYFNAALLKKPAFTDFENGLFTYPVLILREQLAEQSVRDQLDSFFLLPAEKRQQKQAKDELQNFFDQHGARQLAKSRLEQVAAEIRELIAALPGQKERELIGEQLDKLMDF